MCPFYAAKHEFNSFVYAKKLLKNKKTSRIQLDFWNILHFFKVKKKLCLFLSSVLV